MLRRSKRFAPRLSPRRRRTARYDARTSGEQPQPARPHLSRQGLAAVLFDVRPARRREHAARS